MKVSATSRTTSMAAAGAAEQRAMGVVRDGGRVASLKREPKQPRWICGAVTVRE
jgi:hypothetical protein